jgi:DNA primase large subunit
MDEDVLETYVRSLMKSADYLGKPINYVELKALIRRFVELNPHSDPKTIDWVGVWDPTLTYQEQLEAFQRNYPGFRWKEEEISEEAFEEARRRKLEEIVRELDEESLKELLELIKKELKELGEAVEEVPVEQKVQEAVAQEAVVIQEPTPAPTITLKTLAKYPILPEAREFFEAFEVEELDDYAEAVKARVLEAIERGEKGVLPREDPMTDLLTFALARVLALAIGEPWLLRRWALAEASRMERYLHTEVPSLKTTVLKSMINVEEAGDLNGEFKYKMHFVEFLRLNKELGEPKWRLVNRMLYRGYVYLTEAEAIRLFRQLAYQRLSSRENVSKITVKGLPPRLQEAAEDVMGELVRLRSAYAYETATALSEDWPPCIIAIRNHVADASHKELFTLAAFLINRGYSTEQILTILSERPDFNERIARYQVEHIAGLRGSRTKYRPPSCQAMKAYGLCVEDGRLCPRGIKNPLDFRKPKDRQKGPQKQQTTQTHT